MYFKLNVDNHSHKTRKWKKIYKKFCLNFESVYPYFAVLIVEGVEVRFRGAARAKWSETVQRETYKTDIEHEKEEIYFDDRFCLWGKGVLHVVWSFCNLL